MIFIFSVARSGSTWLGKIFDSHPDVFYLHEPNITDRGDDLLPRFWLSEAPTPIEIANAGIYIRRLAGNRTLRSTGTFPVFRKHYRNWLAEIARRQIILCSKLVSATRLPVDTDRLRIPDLISSSRPMTIVIKSVSIIGRAECFVRANIEGFRPVHLIRHPCSYVSSMLRGDKLGVMELPRSVKDLLSTQAATRMKIEEDDVRGATPCQLLAWIWLLQNLEARRALPLAVLVRYEDLATNPIERTKSLFGDLGLSWCGETEAFLSKTSDENGGYYSLRRNSRTAINRWREELDATQVGQIRDIVERDEFGSRYFRIATTPMR